MYALNPEHELRNLFSGLIEQAFIADVGICAPALTDYLAGMLVGFVHVDHIYRPSTVDGGLIRAASRLRAEAELGGGIAGSARDRLINRYIGDFALFWTGLYPEMLQARRQGGVSRLREYLLQGKRGYGLASELSTRDDDPPAELLGDLSAQFECCVRGLHFVRVGWEQLSRGPRQN